MDTLPPPFDDDYERLPDRPLSIVPRDAALPALPTDEELQAALAMFDAAAEIDTKRRMKAAARTERPNRRK